MKTVLKSLPDDFFESSGNHNFTLALSKDNVKEVINSFIDNGGDNALMGFLNFCLQLSGVPLKVAHPGMPLEEFDIDASAVYDVLKPCSSLTPKLQDLSVCLKNIETKIDQQTQMVGESVNPLRKIPNHQEEVKEKVTKLYDLITPMLPIIEKHSTDLAKVSGVVHKNAEALNLSTNVLERNFGELRDSNRAIKSAIDHKLGEALKSIGELLGNIKVIATDVITVNSNLVRLGANYDTLTQQIAALDDLKFKIERAHNGVEEYRLMLEDLLNYETATLSEISKNSAGLVHEMSGVIDNSAILQMLSQVSSLLPAIGNLLSPYSCESRTGGVD